MPQAIVYCARNRQFPNKVYLGVTIKSLQDRKTRHAWEAKNGSNLKFHRAIRKYGIDGFEWAVIDTQPDFFAGLESERKFIAEFAKSHELYNLTQGGGGVFGLRFSRESRQKMAAAKAGKPSVWSNGMPQHVKDRLAAARRAEAGRVLTEKQKLAMRRNAKTANGARRKSVICLDDGTFYESVTAAARAYRVATATITNWCSGKFSSRKGVRLRYTHGQQRNV